MSFLEENAGKSEPTVSSCQGVCVEQQQKISSRVRGGKYFMRFNVSEILDLKQ